MTQLAIDPYVIDGLMPDLIGHDRRASSFVVYLWLYRRAAGTNWTTRASHQSIADATGLSRSAVQTALAHLQKRQLVTTTRAHATAVPQHRVHRPWTRFNRSK